jgi:hypothetical protein
MMKVRILDQCEFCDGEANVRWRSLEDYARVLFTVSIYLK